MDTVTRPGMQTREVNLGTIRVGDTILGSQPRTVLDMRRVAGGRRLTLSDGTTCTLTPGDALIVLRPSRAEGPNMPTRQRNAAL